VDAKEAWKKLNLGGDGPHPFFQRAVAAHPQYLNHTDRLVEIWTETGRLNDKPSTSKWQGALIGLRQLELSRYSR